MKGLAILSGGMDSVTMLHKLIADGNQMSAISFDYGQKHRRELEFAEYWCEHFGIAHDVVPLGRIFSGSALTCDKEMPLEDYSTESMKATVVPNRNMVMISIAVSKGIAAGCDFVAYGAHAGDRDVYPDCRPEFVGALQAAIKMCDWASIDLIAPLLHMTKTDVARLAKKLNVDLSKTWSCYEGGSEPCGKCGACRSRITALENT